MAAPPVHERIVTPEYIPIGLQGCAKARDAEDSIRGPRHPQRCPGDPSPSYSQAVDHSASLPPVVLLLPLLQPPDHLEQRALGGGCVPVGGPADVLEVLDYAVPVLGLRTERLSGVVCWGCSTAGADGREGV